MTSFTTRSYSSSLTITIEVGGQGPGAVRPGQTDQKIMDSSGPRAK